MILSNEAKSVIKSELINNLVSLELIVETQNYYMEEQEVSYVGAKPEYSTQINFDEDRDDIVAHLATEASYYSVVRCAKTGAGFPWPMLSMTTNEAHEAHEAHFKGMDVAPFSKEGFLALKEIFTAFHQHVADEAGIEKEAYYLKKFKYAA